MQTIAEIAIGQVIVRPMQVGSAAQESAITIRRRPVMRISEVFIGVCDSDWLSVANNRPHQPKLMGSDSDYQIQLLLK